MFMSVSVDVYRIVFNSVRLKIKPFMKIVSSNQFNLRRD